MRARDIVHKAMISKATLKNYQREGIVQVESVDPVTREREFAEDSAERAALARRLTRLGFRVAQIKDLLDNFSIEDVEDKVVTLSAEELKSWVEEHSR